MIGRCSRPHRLWLISGGMLLCGVLCQHASARAEPPPDQRRSSAVDGRQALQHAAALVQQGRLDEAATHAERALSDPAARPVAYSVLGAIRLQQQRLTESAGFLEKAIALMPRLPGAQLNLAQVYQLQGKHDAALATVRRVLKQDPSNAAATSALDAFRQSAGGLIALATESLAVGDRAAATALAHDWMRLEHVPVASSIAFALRLAESGAAAQAIAVLERAKSAGVPSYELAFNLGSAYLLNQDPARALTAYDEALAISPDALPALRQAAVVAERQNELERSLSYWMRARKLAPEDPEILLGFGRVCLRMDLLDDAEPALEKAARLKPGEPSYQYTLAAAKVGKRQFEAAQKLLEPMVAARPKDPHLQYALGSVLYIQGRLDEAAARLKESARLRPEQLASHYYLALVARDQGHDAEAIAMLEQLLTRFPDHAASCEALGSLLMGARRYDEAEANLRKAIRLNPGSVRANYQLGLLLARMGRKDEADRQLEHATTLRDKDATESRLQLRLLEPVQ